MNGLKSVALGLLAMLLATPTHGAAQGLELVGIRAGLVSAELAWSPDQTVESRGGAAFHVFGRVGTPAPSFDIGVAGGYVQRGGKVPVEGAGGAELLAEVQSDYFSFRLRGELSASLGSIRLYAGAGPVLETLLRTKHDSNLTPLFTNPTGTQFLLGMAGGLAVTGGFGEVGIEVGYDLGLSNAYDRDFQSVQHRGPAVMLSFGVPGSRFTGG